MTPPSIAASSRASCSSAAGLVVGVTGARDRDREAPRRCRHGRSARRTPLLLGDLRHAPAVHRRLRRRMSFVAAVGLLVGKPWADDRGSRDRRSSPSSIGAIGLILVDRRSRSASRRPPRPARPTTGSASSAPSLSSTCFVIVALAVARLPAAHLDRSRGMTATTAAAPLRPSARYPRVRGLRHRPRRLRRPRRRRRRPAEHGARLDRRCRGSSR